MVKPPKTMQPEAVQLDKAGRGITKAFTENSFHNYMARKIDLQRQQFGLVLPPPPPASKAAAKITTTTITSNHISKPPIHKLATLSKSQEKNNQELLQSSSTPSFEASVQTTKQNCPKRKRSTSSKGFGISSVLKRLQKRHGVVSRKRKRPWSNNISDMEEIVAFSSTTPMDCLAAAIDNAKQSCYDDDEKTSKLVETCSDASTSAWTRRRKDLISSSQQQEAVEERSDLFLRGIVVMINGYTHPDAETLQRLLHRHGGDLEKYETSRVTHILAEQLSTAKANMYKRQRNPKPVCKPTWIVDCVRAQKLLPHTEYLLDQIRNDDVVGTKSLKTFFPSTDSGPMVSSVPSMEKDENPRESGSTANELLGRLNDKANYLDYEKGKESIVKETKDIPRDDGNTADETICGAQDQCQTSSEIFQNESLDPHASPSTKASSKLSKTDKYINGRIRTVGTDPNFLESFFAASRLSFIGSYKQRTRRSPQKNSSLEKDDASERLVFHVDMDSFFASVVLRNYPEYRDKPVVISHHGGESHGTNAVQGTVPKNSSSECATCNYEARKYGIQKGMYLGRAKALCPDLIILQYDFEGYEEVSESVTEILYRYAAEYDGFVEQVSCDESYVEFHFPKPCNVDDKPSSLASQVAERIRHEIFEATQCTATVGVGPNKLLAKLATDHVKPNKSFVVHDYRDLLRHLNLRDLHGIGYRLERKLENEGLVTVRDVWDLGSSGEKELCRILGPGIGKKVYGYCQGKDERPVQPAERKTIGAECNYGVRFDGPYGVDHMIEGLCREVEKRMASVGVKGMKLTLKVKQRKAGAPPPPKFLGHGSCHNLSHSSNLSRGTATREWKVLFDVAWKIFGELNVPVDDIRGMGIVVSKLISDDNNINDQGATNKSIAKWLIGPNLEANKMYDTFETKDRVVRVRFTETLALSQNDQVEYSATQATKYIDLVECEDQNKVNDYFVQNTDAEESASHEGETIEDDQYDIAIPSLSQIHMSQVEELPSPLRNRIRFKVEQEMARKKSTENDTVSLAQKSSRFFQTDVQRMFRLAAIKTGEQQLENGSGMAVSLSQLECLPFEMQLQLANNDKQRIGFLSSGKKKTAVNKVTVDKPDCKINKNQEEIAEHVNDQKIVALPYIDETTGRDPRAFYRENVLPLRIFMDENQVGAETTAQVIKFLSICVDEERIADAIVLLRSIKNRSDTWGSFAFESIWFSIKDKIERWSGSPLDDEWALQI